MSTITNAAMSPRRSTAPTVPAAAGHPVAHRTPAQTLSAAVARRIAVAAQGLGRSRPLDAPPPTRRQVRAAATAQGILQIDSVNVLARAHYVPLFSRLGSYDTALLDDAVWPAGRQPRVLVEAWAHEASMVPVEVFPLLWWRRRDHAKGRWGSDSRLATEHPGFVDDVAAMIQAEGPLSAGQVAERLSAGPGEGGWWGWSAAKVACELLFASGRIATAHRRGFERFYDTTERVLPSEVLEAALPDEEAAKRSLVELAARRLGIGTVADLADFFRMRTDDTTSAVADLCDDGTLVPISVQGWTQPGYLHADARIPRSVPGAALLCPFDPMIWFRRRTERIFGVRYRIEIYTPAEKRVHGYYVFPLLVDGHLVARFDLKADRQGSALLVQASWAEPGHDPAVAVEAATIELRRMADWLGLDDVVARRRGDLRLPFPA